MRKPSFVNKGTIRKYQIENHGMLENCSFKKNSINILLKRIPAGLVQNHTL
jgi:hypothetical protein